MVNTGSPSFTLKLNGEDFENLQIDFYQENEKVLMKYVFSGKIKNVALEEFARLVMGNFYEITKEDMERIKDAINSKKG